MAKKRAIKEHLILRNPTEDCIAPKVQKFEMQILQPEHIKTYLDAADKRGLLPMFYLELVSGLRKGEITALLWSDLDIQNRTISVSKEKVLSLSDAQLCTDFSSNKIFTFSFCRKMPGSRLSQ